MDRHLNVEQFYETITENENNDSILGGDINIYTRVKEYDMSYNMLRKKFFVHVHKENFFTNNENKEKVLNILKIELRRKKLLKIQSKMK